MLQREIWLPPAPPGTSVAGGFDGSENNDWTGIKLETKAGYLFTPRYGPDQKPAVWNPAEWNGRIPRHQVDIAWDEICDRYDVRRSYCDPGFHDESDWSTEIEDWDQKHGPDVFVAWPTNQVGRMYPAIRRFESDLQNRRFKHDGCPITSTHVGNTRKIPVKGDKYILGKPSLTQKIDMSVVSILAHEAACDERAAGWPDKTDPTVFVLR